MSRDNISIEISNPISKEIALLEIIQCDWEFELDLMSTTATIEALELHLDKVPDVKSATAQFLKGFIASHAHTN